MAAASPWSVSVCGWMPSASSSSSARALELTLELRVDPADELGHAGQPRPPSLKLRPSRRRCSSGGLDDPAARRLDLRDPLAHLRLEPGVRHRQPRRRGHRGDEPGRPGAHGRGRGQQPGDRPPRSASAHAAHRPPAALPAGPPRPRSRSVREAGSRRRASDRRASAPAGRAACRTLRILPGRPPPRHRRLGPPSHSRSANRPIAIGRRPRRRPTAARCPLRSQPLGSPLRRRAPARTPSLRSALSGARRFGAPAAT